MKGWVLPMFTIGALIGAGTQNAEAAGKEKLALQGTWVAVKAEQNGKPAEDIVGHWLTFAGDRFVVRSKDGKVLFQGGVQLPPGKRFPFIDFLHTTGSLKGWTWKGIYSLEGTTLRVCDNGANLEKDRPTAFNTEPGSGHVSIVFQRVQP